MKRSKPSRVALFHKIAHARSVIELLEQRIDEGLRIKAPNDEMASWASTIDAQKRLLAKLERQCGY